MENEPKLRRQELYRIGRQILKRQKEEQSVCAGSHLIFELSLQRCVSRFRSSLVILFPAIHYPSSHHPSCPVYSPTTLRLLSLPLRGPITRPFTTLLPHPRIHRSIQQSPSAMILQAISRQTITPADSEVASLMPAIRGGVKGW